MVDPSRAPSQLLTGRLVDVHRRQVVPVELSLAQGRIAALREIPAAAAGPTFLAPGFVDAHVHIESSMLPPSEFARLAVVHGTVGTVSDPHEIANVLGAQGVRWMLDDARGAVLKICLGAPSCVPATPFDLAGAALQASEVAELLSWPEIGYLSEMMNYPGVVAGDPEVLAKCAAARAIGKPLDGHAPGLRGAGLATYVAQGISTDHECVALDEAREKLSLGMKIQIREGSAARNFAALWPLLIESPQNCLLCSDDKHPNDLVLGHLDVLVRRALAEGAELFDVWRAASSAVVEHYRLPIGLLRAGDPADLIEVDNLASPRVLRTWIDGQLVASQGKTLLPRRGVQPINQFHATPKRPADFVVPAQSGRARVIVARDGQLLTDELLTTVPTSGGQVQCDLDRDILKLALVDRFGNRPPVVALVHRFGLREGAIASSVSHDSHQIVAVGTNDHDLCRAVNLLIEHQGGLAAAAGKLEQVLPLEIAGLMSTADGREVAAAYARLDALAKQFGSSLGAPFMTLSFLALLVIPSLKLGPCGLFDVAAFRPVSLWEV